MIILFDYDGTLHKTEAVYGYAVRKALKELQAGCLDVPPGSVCADSGSLQAAGGSFHIPPGKLCVQDTQLSKYLGMNAVDMWEDFLPGLGETVRRKMIEKVGTYMIEGIEKGISALYNGTEALLDELKNRGHTMLMLSNCTIRYMEAQRRIHGLDRWFSGYYCSEAYHNLPKEEIFCEIRKEYPGSYLMIGDRESDIRVARTHGFPSIGCAYGYGNEGELSEADRIVEAPGEILARILPGK